MDTNRPGSTANQMASRHDRVAETVMSPTQTPAGLASQALGPDHVVHNQIMVSSREFRVRQVFANIFQSNSQQGAQAGGHYGMTGATGG
jgi:hypothetical protein